MRVWNITTPQAARIATNMGIEIKSIKQDSVAIDITLRPVDSRSKYSRSSYSYEFSNPRRGPWLCYHGFETFIRAAFLTGATRIKSTMGDWRSIEAFNSDLPALATRNAGSRYYPIALGDECPCDCSDGR